MHSQYSLNGCHPEWTEILHKALDTMDQNYLQSLYTQSDWLPGKEHIFAAFSLPLSQTQYLLLGESPYPRAASANGYAFWDQAVGSLWSTKGLSTQVNKATSLRNWIKALLVARGDLGSDLSQESISRVDKSRLVQTAEDFFGGMMRRGILLLNASLVYSPSKVPFHARYWKPFMKSLLEQMVILKPEVQLILFGKIAEAIPQSQLAV